MTTDTSSSATIQRGIGPTIGLCTEVPLYFRANDFASYEHARQQWRFVRGGHVYFNTYFNGLSVRRWKATAPLHDLRAEVSFSGHITVRVHLMRVGAIATLQDEVEWTSPDVVTRRLAVGGWSKLDDGILFLSVHAHDDSVLEGFAFVTSTPSVRPVRLGLCITHYDRKAQIVPAVARLKRQLVDDPALAGRVGLVVIDNSRNLEAADVDGATLLPNPNLGGAGGFARGMMHLRDDGSYTHALLMDDDASCEVESIRRTIALLAYAREPRTAISGAMLRTLEPYRQFERGARFEGFCRPLASGVDLRDPGVLAWNEREQSSDYGGWWFFAFPLAATDAYPFPYFVRGDDVDFALRHQFDIVHANGIASWQDDFAHKHGPQQQYLDTRSHLLHILHGYRGGPRLALMVALRLFVTANLAGQYELAAAAVMAIGDVLRGPAFFRAEADLADPRRRLQALVRAEKMRSMDTTGLRDADVTGLHESRWRNRWRHLTLNGHLIPRMFFHRRAARFDKTFVLPLRGTFRRRQVIVHEEFSGTGMVLEHSKRHFFMNAWQFARATGALVLRFDDLSRQYRDAYPELTSDGFWRAQFGMSPVASTASNGQHAAAKSPSEVTSVPLAHAA